MELKKIKGHTTEEQIKSIDGLLNALDEKVRLKNDNGSLSREMAILRQQFTAVLDFLGIVLEPNAAYTVRKVRITEADNEINPISS